MIEFALPWMFALLPMPWIVWRFLPPLRERLVALRFPFFRQITAAAGFEAQPGSLVPGRHPAELWLGVIVWVLLLTALARPEQVGKPIELEKAARDVILAIDISGSMDEVDFATPDGKPVQRLAGVKRVVGDFVAAREGDRIGLIVFGAKAFVQSPFTEDLATVRDLLDQTVVGMAGPNTVIGDAIGLAIRTFEASDIDQRLLILLSDGADTGSRMSPLNAAGIAADNGVEIHTIAVGTPQGNAEQRVDVATLEAVAERAGGNFFLAGDLDGLAATYARIDELAARKIETLSWPPRRALAYLPLGGAVVVMLIGFGALLLNPARVQHR